ncbi:hypothetical protein RJ640_001711 [Escallonia rubra]|uniref:Transcriptional factor DELLA N-terminal domain-containing protein n=1 Tax=Escallonia rubra TaxID=112253 RepID=A0AA88QF21_9ASTE|nr:hypothetical protein RJ640_001711 [Escallonia rubra]
MGPYYSSISAGSSGGGSSSCSGKPADPIDSLLAGAGYMVLSSELWQVARCLETVMVNAPTEVLHLTNDAIHYNPSDVASTSPKNRTRPIISDLNRMVTAREYKIAVFESMKIEEIGNSLVFHTRELDSFDEQVDRDQVTETSSKNIDDVHENAVERLDEEGSDAPTGNLIEGSNVVDEEPLFCAAISSELHLWGLNRWGEGELRFYCKMNPNSPAISSELHLWGLNRWGKGKGKLGFYCKMNLNSPAISSELHLWGLNRWGKGKLGFYCKMNPNSPAISSELHLWGLNRRGKGKLGFYCKMNPNSPAISSELHLWGLNRRGKGKLGFYCKMNPNSPTISSELHVGIESMGEGKIRVLLQNEP